MKANCIKFKEKAIRKAQQNLKRTQTKGIKEEIAEGQEILDDAILDKKMHPIGCTPTI